MDRLQWEDAMIAEAANVGGPDFVPSLGYRRRDLVAVAAIIVADRAEAARWASLTDEQKAQERIAAAKSRRDFALAEARDYPSEWDSEMDRRRFCADAHQRYNDAVEKIEGGA